MVLTCSWTDFVIVFIMELVLFMVLPHSLWQKDKTLISLVRYNIRTSTHVARFVSVTMYNFMLCLWIVNFPGYIRAVQGLLLRRFIFNGGCVSKICMTKYQYVYTYICLGKNGYVKFLVSDPDTLIKCLIHVLSGFLFLYQFLLCI